MAEDLFEIVSRDEAEPYGLAQGSHTGIYKKVIDKVGDLKPDEMLKIKVSSTGMQSRIKKKLIQYYEVVSNRLEIFGLHDPEDDQRYMYIRYKKAESNND